MCYILSLTYVVEAAFSARMYIHEDTFNSYSTILFKVLDYNEGSHFNKENGVFTAPTTGCFLG